MLKRAMIGLCLCCILAAGCKKSSTNPGYTADCSGAVKSYKTDVQPVIQSACARCHSNFSSYSGVTGNLAGIRSRIVDGSMPQNSTLSAVQKNSVICWIDNGAPNN